jgi:hypothetical protein
MDADLFLNQRHDTCLHIAPEQKMLLTDCLEFSGWKQRCK